MIIVIWNILRWFIEKQKRNWEKTKQIIAIISTCFLHIIAQGFACNHKICLTNWKSKMPILTHSYFFYCQYHICLYWRFLFKRYDLTYLFGLSGIKFVLLIFLVCIKYNQIFLIQNVYYKYRYSLTYGCI